MHSACSVFQMYYCWIAYSGLKMAHGKLHKDLCLTLHSVKSVITNNLNISCRVIKDFRVIFNTL